MKQSQSKLEALMANAYILGGSPCSGKSTLAERLSQEFGFSYFKVDDHLAEYEQKCNSDNQPIMHQFSKLSWNEIWSKPVEDQVSEVFQYYQELFPFILADLQELGSDPSYVMESAAFLPGLLDCWPVNRDRVLFMAPTPEFQISHYRSRPWIQPILRSCENPEFAFSQWMKRDELFGRAILQQAKQRGFRILEVDGSVSIDDQYQHIIQMLFLKQSF